MKDASILDLHNAISGDFTKVGLSNIISGSDIKNIEELKKYLIKKISELMDKNYDQLINALYRIDISEEKLKKIFMGKNRENIPVKIADLIIERQLQKISFRKKYKEGKI